jgi:hypothetical protein
MHGGRGPVHVLHPLRFGVWISVKAGVITRHLDLPIDVLAERKMADVLGNS